LPVTERQPVRSRVQASQIQAKPEISRYFRAFPRSLRPFPAALTPPPSQGCVTRPSPSPCMQRLSRRREGNPPGRFGFAKRSHGPPPRSGLPGDRVARDWRARPAVESTLIIILMSFFADSLATISVLFAPLAGKALSTGLGGEREAIPLFARMRNHESGKGEPDSKESQIVTWLARTYDQRLRTKGWGFCEKNRRI